MSLTIKLKASESEACCGWHCRLDDLGKGYSVSERSLPFGRTSVCLKRNGVALILKQGGQTAVRTVINDPTTEHLAMLDDLRRIGMLADEKKGSQR